MKERDEALLDLLFGQASEKKRDALDLETREELRELEGVLLRARNEIRQTAEWSPIREGALVGRVLARTTREDLSWRGDLRLVTSFVRERVAASAVLKLVAASLLLHLIALPVVGWYVLREPEKRPTIYIGPPLETQESAFLDVEEEGEDTLDNELAAERRLAERVENARRRARYVLSLPVEPIVEPGTAIAAQEAALEIRLLALRTGATEEGATEEGATQEGATQEGATEEGAAERWGSWVEDEERFVRADRLQRVLWIDVLLDRNVQTGQHSPLLRAGLNRLALAAENDAASPDELEVALMGLERMALDRARSYGLWEAGAGFDPLEAPGPFDPEWCADLSELLQQRGLGEHPVWRTLRSRCAP